MFGYLVLRLLQGRLPTESGFEFNFGPCRIVTDKAFVEVS
jgi:hypothetical protein